MALLELSDEEGLILRDSLYFAAKMYIEQAETHYKWNGEVRKGFDSLIKYYFRKAEVLSGILNKLWH